MPLRNERGQLQCLCALHGHNAHWVSRTSYYRHWTECRNANTDFVPREHGLSSSQYGSPAPEREEWDNLVTDAVAELANDQEGSAPSREELAKNDDASIRSEHQYIQDADELVF